MTHTRIGTPGRSKTSGRVPAPNSAKITMSKTRNGSATKNITIIPATGGAFSHLAICAGTSVEDVKNQLGLGADMVLTRGKGSEPIPPGENLYETTADGAKLYASSDVQWGIA